MIESLKKPSSAYHTDIVKKLITKKFKKCQLVENTRKLRLDVKRGNMIRFDISCSGHCGNRYVVTMKKLSLYIVISLISKKNTGTTSQGFFTKSSGEGDEDSSGDDFVQTPYKPQPSKMSVNPVNETARNSDNLCDSPIDLSIKVKPTNAGNVTNSSSNNKSDGSSVKVVDKTFEKGQSLCQGNKLPVLPTPSTKNTISFFAPDTLQGNCNDYTLDDVFTNTGKESNVSVSLPTGPKLKTHLNSTSVLSRKKAPVLKHFDSTSALSGEEVPVLKTKTKTCRALPHSTILPSIIEESAIAFSNCTNSATSSTASISNDVNEKSGPGSSIFDITGREQLTYEHLIPLQREKRNFIEVKDNERVKNAHFNLSTDNFKLLEGSVVGQTIKERSWGTIIAESLEPSNIYCVWVFKKHRWIANPQNSATPVFMCKGQCKFSTCNMTCHVELPQKSDTFTVKYSGDVKHLKGEFHTRPVRGQHRKTLGNQVVNSNLQPATKYMSNLSAAMQIKPYLGQRNIYPSVNVIKQCATEVRNKSLPFQSFHDNLMFMKNEQEKDSPNRKRSKN